ncbi:MAG: type II secretion system F family protein [Alphaproteobacteria bacterium]
MTRFRYWAYTEAGEAVQGEVDAPDRSGALDRIGGLGHLPYRIEEAGAAGEPWWRRDLFTRHISARRLADLTRELAALVSARLGVEEALEVMIGQGGETGAGRVLRKVRADILEGASLSEALARQPETFPASYVTAVRAGEASGALGEVLERLAAFLERTEAVKAKIRSAMIYPAIVTFMAVLSLVLVMTVVLPGFAPLFEDAGSRLPWLTRMVMDVSGAVQAGWPYALGGLALAVLLGGRVLARPEIRLGVDTRILRMPLIGSHVTNAESARFCRTLSTLLLNGVDLPGALDLTTQALRNRRFAEAGAVLREGVRSGRPLARLMEETGVFPELAVKLAAVGERTGRLGEMLERAAGMFETETERNAERFLSILTPAITVFLGVVVGTIILSVVLAVFSLNEFAF